ncbi:hypothetical protein ES705_11538 [subsurface metagenome]
MKQAQINEELRILEAGSKFISQIFSQYKEKFIAVRNNNLLAIGNSFGEVLDQLKKQGIAPSSVLIEYIPSEEEILAI